MSPYVSPLMGSVPHCPPQRPYMRPHLYWTQQWGQCPTGPPPVSPPMGSVPYRTLTTSPYVSSPHKIPPMSPRLNVPICVSTSIGRSDAVSAPLTPPQCPYMRPHPRGQCPTGCSQRPHMCPHPHIPTNGVSAPLTPSMSPLMGGGCSIGPPRCPRMYPHLCWTQ